MNACLQGRDALAEAAFGGHDGCVEALIPHISKATLAQYEKSRQPRWEEAGEDKAEDDTNLV